MGAEGGRRQGVGLLAATGVLLWSLEARAQEPISAIDWLTERLRGNAQSEPGLPPVDSLEDGFIPDQTGPLPPAPIEAGPLAGQGGGAIRTTVLAGSSPDAAGLFPATDAGLSPGFWGEATRDEAIGAILPPRDYALAALRDLYRRILLAEFSPPEGSDASGALLAARAEALIATGAVDQAAALIAQGSAGGRTPPKLVQSAFDTALLIGDEARVCAEIAAAPGLARDLALRVFCLVRAGDWNAAALTLEIGRSLDRIDPARAQLLAFFLDPSLIEESDTPPPQPEPLTPLDWRLLEAVGEALPTQGLPLAFAHADLGGGAGWKARIEAAERLARVGAIGHGVLFGIYTEARPAASGGIWTRASAVGTLDAALESGDGVAIAAALGEAWTAMSAAGLHVPFARQYGEVLAERDLPPEAAALAFRVGLLSEGARRIAADARPTDAEGLMLRALALGIEADLPADPVARDVVLALTAAEPSAFVPPGMAAEVARGRSALALLTALDAVDAAAAGDAGDLAGALALMRSVGLDRVARAAALELLLIERRG
jgi:hypothetical protein